MPAQKGSIRIRGRGFSIRVTSGCCIFVILAMSFNVGKLRTVEDAVVVGVVVNNGNLHTLSTGTTDTRVEGVAAAVFSASWVVCVFYLRIGMG